MNFAPFYNFYSSDIYAMNELDEELEELDELLELELEDDELEQV